MAVVDSVRALIPGLITGDIDGVLAQFCEEATIVSPLGGSQGPLAWAEAERSWLSQQDLTVSEVNTVTTGSRVVHELVVTAPGTGQTQVTVLLIAEGQADRIATLYESYRRTLVDKLRAAPTSDGALLNPSSGAGRLSF